MGWPVELSKNLPKIGVAQKWVAADQRLTGDDWYAPEFNAHHNQGEPESSQRWKLGESQWLPLEDGPRFDQTHLRYIEATEQPKPDRYRSGPFRLALSVVMGLRLPGGEFRLCCRALPEVDPESGNAWLAVEFRMSELVAAAGCLVTLEPKLEDGTPIDKLFAPVTITAEKDVRAGEFERSLSDGDQRQDKATSHSGYGELTLSDSRLGPIEPLGRLHAAVLPRAAGEQILTVSVELPSLDRASIDLGFSSSITIEDLGAHQMRRRLDFGTLFMPFGGVLELSSALSFNSDDERERFDELRSTFTTPPERAPDLDEYILQLGGHAELIPLDFAGRMWVPHAYLDVKALYAMRPIGWGQFNHTLDLPFQFMPVMERIVLASAGATKLDLSFQQSWSFEVSATCEGESLEKIMILLAHKDEAVSDQQILIDAGGGTVSNAREVELPFLLGPDAWWRLLDLPEEGVIATLIHPGWRPVRVPLNVRGTKTLNVEFTEKWPEFGEKFATYDHRPTTTGRDRPMARELRQAERGKLRAKKLKFEVTLPVWPDSARQRIWCTLHAVPTDGDSWDGFDGEEKIKLLPGQAGSTHTLEFNREGEGFEQYRIELRSEAFRAWGYTYEVISHALVDTPISESELEAYQITLGPFTPPPMQIEVSELDTEFMCGETQVDIQGMAEDFSGQPMYLFYGSLRAPIFELLRAMIDGDTTHAFSYEPQGYVGRDGLISSGEATIKIDLPPRVRVDCSAAFGLTDELWVSVRRDLPSERSSFRQMECRVEFDPADQQFIDLWAPPGELDFVAYSPEYEYRTKIRVDGDGVLALVLPEQTPKYDVTFLQEQDGSRANSRRWRWSFYHEASEQWEGDFFTAGEEQTLHNRFAPGDWVGIPSDDACSVTPGDAAVVRFTVHVGKRNYVKLPPLIDLSKADPPSFRRRRHRVQARIPIPEDVQAGLRDGSLGVHVDVQVTLALDVAELKRVSFVSRATMEAGVVLAVGELLLTNLPRDRRFDVSITLRSFETQEVEGMGVRAPKKDTTRTRYATFPLRGHDGEPRRITPRWKSAEQ